MCYQASNICRILSEGPAGGIEEYDRILSEGLNHLSPNADASAMDANGFINSFWIAIYERYQQGPTAGIGSEQMILLFNSMDEGLFALGKADLFLFAREVRRIGEKVLVPILQRGIFFRDAVALYDHATRTGVELEQAVRSFEFLSGQDHVDIRALCQELANLKDQQSRLAIVETQIRALQTQAGEIRSSCDGIERRLGLKA
jgi:hypothetical protein